MLTDIHAENFQSLRKLSLLLGRFTVVTGPTGSGKSSVFRAMELLAHNARGTGYIRRGAKSCKVASGDREQAWAVGIERGTARGKDAYRVVRLVNDPMHPDRYLDEPEVDTFTKLGGEVPASAAALLQLSELNFARQFDRPFLLDSSGGEIARVLGRLTNVTLLFDAAREANRRRLELAGDLRRAEANLAGLTEQAQRFRGMRERQAAVSEAESALQRVHALNARQGRLRVLLAKLEDAEEALEAAAPPEVPDGSRLEELAVRLARLRSLYAQWDTALMEADGAQFAAERAQETLTAAEGRLHEVLVDAGQCPVCGQAVA